MPTRSLDCPPQPDGADHEADLPPLEAELAACLPILPVLARQLTDMLAQAEAAVDQVCQRFQAINERVWTNMQQAAESLGQGEGGKGATGQAGMESMCRLVRTTLEQLQGQVMLAATATQDAARQIEAANQTLRGIDALLHDVDQIASRTRLLALNAKIEAVRAGEHGKAFAVVADETKNLAGHAARTTESIRTILERATRQVGSTAAGMLARSTASREAAEAATADVERVLGVVASTHESMQQSLEAGFALTQDLRQDVSQAVVGLQFQDTASQRVRHVVEALEEIHQTLAPRISGESTHPASDDWAGRLLGSYTMAQERRVQHQTLDGSEDDPGLGANIELF